MFCGPSVQCSRTLHCDYIVISSPLRINYVNRKQWNNLKQLSQQSRRLPIQTNKIWVIQAMFAYKCNISLANPSGGKASVQLTMRQF